MYRKFSAKLKELRVELFFTQQEMATHAQIPLSTYKYWEYGYCLPNGKHFVLLKKFFEELKVDTFALEQAYKTAKIIK
jgi:DNA-binding XRE family transcriptional regulator